MLTGNFGFVRNACAVLIAGRGLRRIGVLNLADNKGAHLGVGAACRGDIVLQGQSSEVSAEPKRVAQ